jgi:hypothetical protein
VTLEEERTVVEKVVVSLPRPRWEVASHVRSTLLLSSVQSLRKQGFFDRYAAASDPSLRETLVTTAAGVWVPMELALAHYRACEAMGLSQTEQVQLGREVGEHVQGSFIGVVARAARTVGATPWVALEPVARLWDRVFQGGAGPSVLQLGPKEGRVELVGLPLLDVPYFRHAYRGTFIVALELFCTKVYVSEHRGSLPRRGEVTFRVSWV